MLKLQCNHFVNKVNMDLNGTLPSEIGAIENLTALALAGNEIEGRLPTQLFQLKNLKSMNFGEMIDLF